MEHRREDKEKNNPKESPFQIEDVVTPGRRDSTATNKMLFLTFLGKFRGIVTATCEKTEIPRSTVYDWLKKDKKFRKAFNNILATKLEILEDRLMSKAIADGDTRALTYLIDRYTKKKEKPETVVHIHHHADKGTLQMTPIKTFEDLLYDQALKKKLLAEEQQGKVQTDSKNELEELPKLPLQGKNKKHVTGASNAFWENT